MAWVLAVLGVAGLLLAVTTATNPCTQAIQANENRECLEPVHLRSFPSGHVTKTLQLTKCGARCSGTNRQFVRFGLVSEPPLMMQMWVTSSNALVEVYLRNFTDGGSRNIAYSVDGSLTSPVYSTVQTDNEGTLLASTTVAAGEEGYISPPLMGGRPCAEFDTTSPMTVDVYLPSSSAFSDSTIVNSEGTTYTTVKVSAKWINTRLDWSPTEAFAQLVVPHTTAANVSFTDTDNACATMAGVATVFRAPNELYVSGYEVHLSSDGDCAVSGCTPGSSSLLLRVTVEELGAYNAQPSFSVTLESQTWYPYIIVQSFNDAGYDEGTTVSAPILDLCPLKGDAGAAVPKATLLSDPRIDLAEEREPNTLAANEYSYTRTIATTIDSASSASHVYHLTIPANARWSLSFSALYNHTWYLGDNGRYDYVSVGLEGVAIFSASVLNSVCPDARSPSAIEALEPPVYHFLSLSEGEPGGEFVNSTSALAVGLTYDELDDELKGFGVEGMNTAQWSDECWVGAETELVVYMAPKAGFAGSYQIDFAFDDFSATLTEGEQTTHRVCLSPGTSRTITAGYNHTHEVVQASVSGGDVHGLLARFNAAPTQGVYDMVVAGTDLDGVDASVPCAQAVTNDGSGLLFIEAFVLDPDLADVALDTQIFFLHTTPRKSRFEVGTNDTLVLSYHLCCRESMYLHVDIPTNHMVHVSVSQSNGQLRSVSLQPENCSDTTACLDNPSCELLLSAPFRFDQDAAVESWVVSLHAKRSSDPLHSVDVVVSVSVTDLYATPTPTPTPTPTSVLDPCHVDAFCSQDSETTADEALVPSVACLWATMAVVWLLRL